MSLLQLSYELDLSPKRVASTHGGEYHSPCPLCGGKDRFIIWEKQGRYLCRQCATKGDEIQFCRDFMGMDYRSACAKLGKQAKTSFRFVIEPPRFTPFHADPPSAIWQKSAKEFVCFGVEQLNDNKEALQGLYERGFSSEGISLFSLGWNPVDQFVNLSEWGLPLSWNEAGREKKVWLPKGIVIPTFTEERVIKLKVRRSEKDQRPKYIEISGSMKCPSLYGSIGKTVVIVEAELDAMLITPMLSLIN